MKTDVNLNDEYLCLLGCALFSTFFSVRAYAFIHWCNSSQWMCVLILFLQRFIQLECFPHQLYILLAAANHSCEIYFIFSHSVLCSLLCSMNHNKKHLFIAKIFSFITISALQTGNSMKWKFERQADIWIKNLISFLLFNISCCCCAKIEFGNLNVPVNLNSAN